MDGAIGGTSDDAVAWLSAMTSYVAAIDPHHHLVSNRFILLERHQRL